MAYVEGLERPERLGESAFVLGRIEYSSSLQFYTGHNAHIRAFRGVQTQLYSRLARSVSEQLTCGTSVLMIVLMTLCIQGWSDIYYFCGQDYRYCRCDFTWNLAGWGKALVLWNFVVTASLGLQKLVIHCGLNGLLPGQHACQKQTNSSCGNKCAMLLLQTQSYVHVC